MVNSEIPLWLPPTFPNLVCIFPTLVCKRRILYVQTPNNCQKRPSNHHFCIKLAAARKNN